jgi:protocatechuate 3,4-dioxygenase beta subunit
VTQTDAQGQYRFEGLRPGVYQVREVQPAGYFDGAEHVGTEGGILLANDLISDIRLLAGRQALHYDFCELPGATLSGYVFVDGPPIEVDDLARDVPAVLENLAQWRDGRRTPDDAPLAGVRLLLADATGQLLLDSSGRPLEAVTDARGFYQFGPLPPGLYTVIQVQPSGYVSGFNVAGSTGGLPLGGAVRGPHVMPLALSGPGLDLAHLAAALGGRDAIALIPLAAGEASVENNFSEVQFVGVAPRLVFPPPPSPPPPFLPTPPAIVPVTLPMIPSMVLPVPEPPAYGRGGYVQSYTWHLSIIDAGFPRGEPPSEAAASAAVSAVGRRPSVPGQEAEGVLHEASLVRTRLTRANWSDGPSEAGGWTLLAGQSGKPHRIAFGAKGGLPVTGDFDGDGVTDLGIYLDGQWFIDLNGNGRWDDDDLWARLGTRDDLPVTGDWDGDGKTDIGIFGPVWPKDPRAIVLEPGLPAPMNEPAGKPKNVPPPPQEATSGWRTLQRTREGDLRADLIDHVFHFGEAGDIPISGDWTGAGLDAIGVFRQGTWILDTDGDGRLTERDARIQLGQPGDKPVVADFNGDGIDELGVYRNGQWYIDVNRDRAFDERDLIIQAGGPDDLPVVGDWDGDGLEQPGFYTPHSLGLP